MSAQPPAKRARSDASASSTTTTTNNNEASVLREASAATRTLAAMFDQKALMDCRLVVYEKAGSEAVVLHAHRAVLAASSRPFHSMLLGELREASSANNELTLHEVSPARLAELLQFVYGQPVALEPAAALPLYRLADMYEVLDLADLCCEYLKGHADDVSQCCAMLAAADEVHCFPVVQHCVTVLTRHFEAAAKHEGFLHLSQPLLTSLLADKELSVRSEAGVLDAMLAWVDFDESRLAALPELAALIRWPQLDAARIAWLEIHRPTLFAPGTTLAEFCREAYRFQALQRAPQRDEPLLARLATARTKRRPRQRFDASRLTFVGAVGSKGQESGGFNCPEGVALSSQGLIFVADSLNHRVQVFEPNGTFLRAFGTHGSQPGQFNMPGGVAIGAASEHDDSEIVVVTDQGNGRLQLFTSEGRFVRTISGPGSADGELLEPTGVVVSPTTGEIIVADYQNCRVQVFDREGSFLRKFGSPGEGDGQFKHPSGIALSPDGHLVVADYQNDRLQCFEASTGRFLHTIGRHGNANGEFERPFDVAIASDGHILATDYENHRVLSPTGEYVSHFGSHGSGVAQFDSPGGVAVSPDGDVVVVTDCGNGRFHLYKEAATVPATLPASASGVAAVQPALMLVPPPPMPTPIAVPGGGG